MASVIQEDIILNICVPNNKASKHTKLKTDKTARIDKSTVTVGDLNTLHSITDKQGERKSAKI